MLSDHHQTIFVHIPKAAGQSVETAFLDDLEVHRDRLRPKGHDKTPDQRRRNHQPVAPTFEESGHDLPTPGFSRRI